MSDFYQSAISDNTNFIIYLDYNGTKHRVDGYRASSQYGYMVRMSYNKISEHFGTAQRTLNGGVWASWDYNTKNSDLAGRLILNSASTGIQSPVVGNTTYRLQIGTDGGATIWKSIDKGKTWNIVKTL